MDFLTFCKIAYDELKSKKKKIRKDVLTLLKIKTCYPQILGKLQEKAWRNLLPKVKNEFLLDLITPINTLNWIDTIVCIQNDNNVFCFGLEEWMHLLHSDLSLSYTDVNEELGITTTLKSFRLPHNPYSGAIFMEKDMIKMLHQYFQKFHEKDIIIFSKYIEIIIFCENLHTVYQLCEGKNKYYTSIQIEEFFESKGLRFEERIDLSTGENKSRWIYDKKRYRRIKNFRQYILEKVFLRLFHPIFNI